MPPRESCKRDFGMRVQKNEIWRDNMKRRIMTFVFIIGLLLAMVPYAVAAAGIPASWKAPGSLTAGVPEETPYCTSLFFSVDSDLLKFIDDVQTDHDALGIDSIGHTAQVDWKLNGGQWHYTPDWDTQSEYYGVDSGIYNDTGYLTGETTQEVMIFDLRNGDGGNTALQDMLGGAMIRGSDESGEDNRLDLENNTFYFRVRFLASYYEESTGNDGYILSPWSDTLAYGKAAGAPQKPTYLEKPTISNPVVGRDGDGSPTITFTAVTPKQVQDASTYIQAWDEGLIAVEHQININNAGWVEAEAGVWWLSGETRTIEVPATYDDGKTVSVSQAYIQIRMRYVYEGGDSVGPLQSDWSNVISLNTPPWSDAHDWAAQELQDAYDAGLIPEILIGADMTSPINREEFAELAVLLYEKVAEAAAEPADPNPFADTTNPQILKAFTLGITTGTTPTTFEPGLLINREQCATMLFRTILAIEPNGDYSIAGVGDFPDQKDISSWAVEATKYMFRIGIIKGDDEGNFMPKATTTAQEAAGYGMATREAAILMSVRTFNQF
jgi:hypothetical protein